MGMKVNAMIDKIIKSVYILTIAMVVFLGGLLIIQGIRISDQKNAQASIPEYRQSIIDSQEGNAL